MLKCTKVQFLYSNSLGISNLRDNPNSNTTLLDTSYWIYHQLFKSNRQSTSIKIKLLIESFSLKFLPQN